MNIKFLALASPALAASSSLVAATPEKPVSIVLVHGGFVDGSGWEGGHNILSKEGYEVIVVQNPTVSLEDDVTVTKRAITAAHHPVPPNKPFARGGRPAAAGDASHSYER